MVEASARAINNEMIKLEVDDKYRDCADHFTGHVRCVPKWSSWFSSASDLWAFETAPKQCLEVGIESIEGKLSQQFSFGGGELAIFDCGKLPDAKWACWIGPWNIAHAMFYEPKCKAGDVVEFFSKVGWHDTDKGLTCDTGLFSKLESAVYLVEIAGIGSLLVEKKSLAKDKIPSFLGFETLLGELWKLAPAIGSTVERLLLVTKSTVCTLDPWDVPWPDGKGKDEPEPDPKDPKPGSAEAAAQFLSSLLDCSWGKK